MSRSREEVAFSTMLGCIGEKRLAPDLLHRIGISEIRNLNDDYPNHPWADYRGRYREGWVGIAVRTRVKWEKPSSGPAVRINESFNGAGDRKMAHARGNIAKIAGVEPNSVPMLWLAIAIDIDDTYEAYWGFRQEMTEVGNGKDRLRIPMTAQARERYAREGRRLALCEPVAVPWLDYPGNWTFDARRRWLELASIRNRDKRIEHAIRDVAPDHLRIVGWTPPAAVKSKAPDGAARRSAKPRAFSGTSLRSRMAGRLDAGDPPPICLAVLGCLNETSSWTNMDTLKELMRHRLTTRGEPWACKSYYDAWNALMDCRMVESRSGAAPHEQRITEAGAAYLRRYGTLSGESPLA